MGRFKPTFPHFHRQWRARDITGDWCPAGSPQMSGINTVFENIRRAFWRVHVGNRRRSRFVPPTSRPFIFYAQLSISIVQEFLITRVLATQQLRTILLVGPPKSDLHKKKPFSSVYPSVLCVHYTLKILALYTRRRRQRWNEWEKTI